MAKINTDSILRIEWQGIANDLNLLAIEASSVASSVALLKSGDVIMMHDPTPMQHSKLLLPMIHILLQEASLSLADVDGIAFGQGPGSYTGIRLATSTAQGLGFAAQKPLIPVSSLAILAQTIYSKYHHRNLFVAVDAHMKQVYWSVYQADDRQIKAIQPDMISLPELIPKPTLCEGYGIGNGWEKYGYLLKSALGEIVIHSIYPCEVATAAALLTLAVPSFLEGKWVKASDARPCYLR